VGAPSPVVHHLPSIGKLFAYGFDERTIHELHYNLGVIISLLFEKHFSQKGKKCQYGGKNVNLLPHRQHNFRRAYAARVQNIIQASIFLSFWGEKISLVSLQTLFSIKSLSNSFSLSINNVRTFG
jgi:hypothetical protein